jgi:hypothetical protein
MYETHYSDKIQNILRLATKEQLDAIEEDLADAILSEELDHTTFFEAFQTGFDLARKSTGRVVFHASTEYITYFFIGEEDFIVDRLKKCLLDNLSEQA